MSLRIELDFTSGYDVSTTVRHLRDGCSDGCSVIRSLAEQIESKTKPPRIPEPGLWGVVREGVDGDTYVRESFGTVRQWSRLGGQGLFVTWDEINNPTLIREGVTA